jgi:nucleoside-diphosphate-sugar epimerase
VNSLPSTNLPDACVFVTKNYLDLGFLNIGSGEETTIVDFARLIAEIVGYRGQITYDSSLPDGMARKLLDLSTPPNVCGFPRQKRTQGNAHRKSTLANFE